VRESDESARRDELLSDLRDRSGEWEPIRPAERAARRARLAHLLGEHGVDALVVEPGATLAYLTGVSWGLSERLFACVLLADGSLFWVTPGFEEPRARATIQAAGAPLGDVLAWQEHEYAWQPLAAELAVRRAQRVAVEPQARLFVFVRLGEALGTERVVGGAPLVRALRMVKDTHELALLCGANELTQQAIAAVAVRIEAGTSDHELGALCQRAQERLGLRSTWVLPLLGPNAALPHGRPEGRVLARGDVVLVDTGGALHGYQSDNTRTWVFDAPPASEVERAWHAVRDAQRAAYEALRPGVRCREIDAAARAVIERAGYGAGYQSFAHRLGHGIGLEGHEEPYLDGGNELALAAGMTFSDEPGIYLPERFGIRLEDIVAVTADGAAHFGDWQPSPTEVA
jgi:Xaa-Pro dipeptidase